MGIVILISVGSLFADDSKELPEETLTTPPVQEIQKLLKNKNFEVHRPPVVKEFTCQDILRNTPPTPNDSDVNMVASIAYTFCVMELTLQKYISYETASRKITKKSHHGLLSRAKKDLRQIQKILPAILDAFYTTYIAFEKYGFRDTINELQIQFEEKRRSSGLSY